jgi:hypothetical protein
MVPMAPEIRGLIRDHDQVEGALGDAPLTTRADVLLRGLVRLYGSDGYVEKTAHAINATITARARTTMTTSSVVFLCSRKGLKPTVRR